MGRSVSKGWPRRGQRGDTCQPKAATARFRKSVSLLLVVVVVVGALLVVLRWLRMRAELLGLAVAGRPPAQQELLQFQRSSVGSSTTSVGLTLVFWWLFSG